METNILYIGFLYYTNVRSRDIISLLNPWWREGGVRKDLAKPYRRRAFNEIVGALEYRQIQIITGLRRVGKSTLLYQTMEHLISSGVDPLNILYYSFDIALGNPLEILKSYSNLTGVDWRNERVYVFFDEIQKAREWSSWLKLIYDSHPNIKLVVSGSSSLHLEENAHRNLAGRFILHKVEPLSLIEFFELKTGRRVENPELWRDDLLITLKDYIRKPFPEIVNWSELRAAEYIRESVLEKVVSSDLSPHGLDPSRTLELLTIFYSEPGSYLNVNSLAGELNMSKKTLYKYLEYMKSSYLVRFLRNYRPSVRASSRKMRRVYPYHWSLTFGLMGDVERGHLVESMVASILDASYYWREGSREVDFILTNGRVVPVEVKAKDRIRKEDLGNLIYFLRKFGLDTGFLIYEGEDGSMEVDGKHVKALSLLSLCIYGALVLD